MPIFARKTTIFSQIRRYLQLKLEKVKKISFPQAQRLTFNAIAAKAYDEAAKKYHQQYAGLNLPHDHPAPPLSFTGYERRVTSHKYIMGNSRRPICPKNPVASRARQPRTPTTPPTC
jgi:hypothetical protein